MELHPEMDKIFTTVTVCLRTFSDISRDQILFSLVLPSTGSGFLIYQSKHGAYILNVLGEAISFWGLQNDSNVWNSLCTTWDATTGLAQMWVNGNPSSRKGVKSGYSLTGVRKIMLGQVENINSGGFDPMWSFVGMLTDVHMWDSVLSPDQIAYYSYGVYFQPGNVLNWYSLEFIRWGYVITESKETSRKAGSV